MFRTIDDRHVQRGVLDVSGFAESETIILAEDLGRVVLRGALRVRNLIVHTGVSLVFEEHAVMGRNVLANCVFLKGVKSHNLNAVGDVIVSGPVVLGDDRSVVEKGRLLIRGDLSSGADIVIPDGCCRISGSVSGPGLLACDDVWAPALDATSRSEAQRRATTDMDDALGREPVSGILGRLFRS